jgi:predicted amidohydrolase
LIAQVNGWRINLNICYDLRFPVWSRQTSNPGKTAPEYDLLVYVANWPESRSHAWKTLLHARAIENQCYVVGVNRVGSDGHGINHSGDSLVIDPLGKSLFMAPDRETVHTQVLKWNNLEEYRSRFPFWRDGDAFRID